MGQEVGVEGVVEEDHDIRVDRESRMAVVMGEITHGSMRDCPGLDHIRRRGSWRDMECIVLHHKQFTGINLRQFPRVDTVDMGTEEGTHTRRARMAVAVAVGEGDMAVQHHHTVSPLVTS